MNRQHMCPPGSMDATAEVHSSELRILMLEDSADDAWLIEQELRRQGYLFTSLRIDTENAFKQAIEKDAWDVILSDFSLPDINALSALDMLNARHQTHPVECPFIVVSGAIGEDMAVTLIKKGAYDFVSKNNLSRLGTAIDRGIRELRLERQQQVTEERHRTLVHSIPDLILELDSDLKILWANDYAQAFFGEDISNRKLSDFAEGPHESEKAQHRLHAIADLTGKRTTFEVRMSAKNAISRLIQWHCAGMRTHGVVRLIATGRDVSDLKNLERRLFHTVEDLKKTNYELEQFAYVASHDLQEPLRSITSFLQLLAQRYKNRLDEDADIFISYAVDGAKRMNTLITNLLTYSKITSSALVRTDCDLNLALKTTLTTLQPVIFDSHAEITSDPLPIVQAEPAQIALVFRHLLTNAIKFHSDSSPKIHFSARPVEHRIWELSVRDNGIGIDPAYAEKIFAVFQKLHPYSGKYAGSGIGLAICQKIINRHGGKIWVESEPGQGSTFKFTLP